MLLVVRAVAFRVSLAPRVEEGLAEAFALLVAFDSFVALAMFGMFVILALAAHFALVVALLVVQAFVAGLPFAGPLALHVLVELLEKLSLELPLALLWPFLLQGLVLPARLALLVFLLASVSTNPGFA